MRSLHSNLSFVRLWVAQSSDEFGSVLGTVALAALAILLLNADAIQVGIMVTIRYTVMPVAGLAAGRVVGKYRPDRLMRLAYLGRALALAALPVAVATHHLTIWLIYAVIIVDGALTAIVHVAFDFVLPRLVEREQLDVANSRIASTNAVGSVAGPGVAGLIAQFIGPAVAVMANAGAYLLSLFALIGMVVAPGPAEEPVVPGAKAPSQRGEAWRALRRNPVLWGVAITLCLWNVAAGMMDANLLVFIFGTGQPPGVVGLILAVGEAGAFVGIFLLAKVSRVTSVGARMMFLPAIAGLAFGLVPVGVSTSTAACAQSISRGHKVGSYNQPDSEVEPMVAGDPSNPQRLIAMVQQDRWSDDGANANKVIISGDGGRTWAQAASQPAFTICEGATPGSPGYFDRASDPWVSIGPDGTAYASSNTFNIDNTSQGFGGGTTVLVSTSTDGGAHWQTPVSAQHDDSHLVLNDKESVTADPLIAGRAYLVWRHLDSPSQAMFERDPNNLTASTMLSITSDGGKTWSPARVINNDGAYSQPFDNQIVVEAAGPHRSRVIAPYLIARIKPHSKTLAPNDDTTFQLATMTSDDGGQTWAGPNIVAPMPNIAVNLITGGTKRFARTGEVAPGFATDPVSGDVYATWQTFAAGTTGTSVVTLSRSTDGGVDWTPPVRIDKAPGTTQSFLPQVHVAVDGTVGVSYDDFRNATAIQTGLTDVFLVRCARGRDCTDSSSWIETQVTDQGPFDITTAPLNGGLLGDEFFLGDYQGLTSVGTTFVPVFVASAPLATHGSSDLFAKPVP